jgi:hypothetical protein
MLLRAPSPDDDTPRATAAALLPDLEDPLDDEDTLMPLGNDDVGGAQSRLMNPSEALLESS